jgi:hypothetical protein
MTSWILGSLAAFFALLGAYLAARAIDIGIFTFGFLLIGFGIVYVFWLTKDYFDQQERARS